MRTMTKYLTTRSRRDGTKSYEFSPSPTFKVTFPDVKYKSFTSKTKAITYCKQMEAKFSANRRLVVGSSPVVSENSVNSLVAYYRGTDAYLQLAENSKTFYEICLKAAVEYSIGSSTIQFGEMDADSVTPSDADSLYTGISSYFSRHRGVHAMKVLRKVWNIGQRHRKVVYNPFNKMDIKAIPPRTTLWEPEQVFKVIDTADTVCNNPSIGTLTLLCYDLCQRPGDMRQLGINNYEQGVVKYTQEKTGTEMEIPCSPRLVERLEKLHLDAPTHTVFSPCPQRAGHGPRCGNILEFNDNKPQSCDVCGHVSSRPLVFCETTSGTYSRDLIVKYFAKVRKHSGIPTTLQLRDLRRTGATEMAESGCTEDELMSVTGHKDRAVVSTYVRKTPKLAAHAISKRF